MEKQVVLLELVVNARFALISGELGLDEVPASKSFRGKPGETLADLMGRVHGQIAETVDQLARGEAVAIDTPRRPIEPEL